MVVLIGMSAAVKGRNFDVDVDHSSIGRRTNNLVIIDDPSISGTHCKITRDGRKFWIQDLGSTNGTRVNGSPIKKSRLNAKDIIQVGQIELMFDGDDIEPDLEGKYRPKIEVIAEPARGPVRAQGNSVFGARQDRHSKLWIYIIVTLALLASGASIYFFFFMD